MPAHAVYSAELADRNAHAADALVAEAEDPLAVGDDDHGGGAGWFAQDLLDRGRAARRRCTARAARR